MWTLWTGQQNTSSNAYFSEFEESSPALVELVTLSWILIAGYMDERAWYASRQFRSVARKPAKIPFSAIGESWKRDIKGRNDFWEEIPAHLVAELQESALKLAEKRGFCPDIVDFLK